MQINRVSVIVVNYNCLSTLNACIGTILSSNSVGELLLVDNASTDKSMESIENYKDSRLKIIRLNKNVGLAAARNLAADRAQFDILAITDADIAVDPKWLDYPCMLLDRHKEFGAVQCNIILRNNINKIASSIMKSGSLQSVSFLEKQYNSYYHILFPVGAAFIIKRSVWNIIGGFDPFFFIGNDDVDFGIRLWSSGFEVVGSKEGTVYHEFGTLRSKKDISPIFKFYALRNMLLIWTKDLQGRSIAKNVLPFFLYYPFMAVRYGGLIGIKGLISYFKDLRLVLDKRYKVQELRRTSDEKIIIMMHDAGTLPIDLLSNDFRLLCKCLNRKSTTSFQISKSIFF
jgi:N-acetylglucosaminyl-diphospho-decaprenol L-rhamnosyltransferase